MKIKIAAILLALFVVLPGIAQKQKENKAQKTDPKFDKAFTKAQELYDEGSYSSSKEEVEDFRKKVNSKLGIQNAYTAPIFFLKAKCDLASGMLTDFETNLSNALTTSRAIYSENSENYCSMLIESAQLYSNNGSYRIAKENLENAKKVLDVSSFNKDLLKARWDIVMAETLTGQGYYNESLDLLRARETFFARRAVKQETLPDGKGGLTSRKLPEEEVTQRMSEYGNVLTLIGNTYGKQGNLRSADSSFVFAATWIKKNVGEKSIAYVKNQFYNANVLVENGNVTLPDELEYNRTLDILKGSFQPSHYLGVQIYEEYLKQLLRQDEDISARYNNVKAEYDRMIKKDFPPKSIFQIRLKAVEFDTRLKKEKTKDLETAANAVIYNTPGLPHNNILVTDMLDFLATLGIQEKKYANCEGYYSEIIKIKADLFGSNAPEMHLARLRLANFYLDYTNKIKEAGQIYEESYSNVVGKEIGAWHKDHLDILNHLAIYYELTDQYAKANAALDKALLVSRSKYDDKDYKYAEELTRIAKLQLRLGQYLQAEKNINKSLEILEEFKKDETKKGLMVETMDAQANLLGVKGLFDDAEDALDRSGRIIAKADRPLGIDELSTAQDLSSLFIMLGRYSDTDEILSKLILEYEKLYGPETLRLIEPLVNKGKLLLAQGDYTEADKIALRANKLAIALYTEKSTKTASSQKLLSDIDYTIGDYDNAEDNIVKALASQEKQFGRNHIDVAKSLAQLGLIKFYKGDDRKQVEKIMIEARDIMGTRLGKTNPQYAEILKSISIVYISEKKYDEAFNALTQAESIWRAKTGTNTSIQAAAIYALTGDVYYQLNKYDKAEEFYKKGKDLYESYFSDTHPEYVKILSKMARVYYQKKDFKGAKKNIEQALNNYENFIKQFFPALSEREKAKYWNTIKGDFEFYNTLAFSQLEDFRDLSGKVYNYQLLTKALLLSSSIKIRERILNSSNADLKANYNLWVRKKEELTGALSMSTAQLQINGLDPVAMGAEVERLERELSERSEIFGQSFENKRITYENVQSALGKNDVAVEMVRYRHFNHTFTDSIVYVALYVKGEKGRPKAIILPEGHRMETRYFKYYRNSITTMTPDQLSYKVFWEPLQKEIGQYATIFISPDGVYNQINLEAIPTPDGKYVIDNSNIVMVSNTKDLYLRKIKSKVAAAANANSASMFGNPTFYLTASTAEQFSPLPGTEKEVEELQKLLKQKGWTTDEFMEAEASEEKVKALNNPRIFHIATHGFYTKTEAGSMSELTENEATMAENPLMKSGLLLKGAGDVLAKTKYNYNMESGVLTAYEAMSLNLDRTDLVVLSACETGLGEISNGEGVYGLQRAFLVAGAKVLIMSMFKVDDDATQKLILNFYKKWLNSGNMRLSFVEAKKELRAEYPEPIYWGAFMMIGLD